MKTFALATTIYEDEVWAERDDIPFIHKKEDLEVLKAEERNLNEKTSLVSMFEDFQGLGLTNLQEKDFLPSSKMQGIRGVDPDELETFIKSERGGGGVAKCYPLGYI